MRKLIGGGGGFTPGGGGGARGGELELEFLELSGFGLGAGFGGALRRPGVTDDNKEGGEEDGGGEEFEVGTVGLRALSRGAVGGLGGIESNGFAKLGFEVGASFDETELLLSPLVLIPPSVFFNLGMPTPAKIPPS